MVLKVFLLANFQDKGFMQFGGVWCNNESCGFTCSEVLFTTSEK